MNTHDAGPEGGTSGRGFRSTGNGPTILQFRPKRKIACCASCGGHFGPRQPSHAYCPRCYFGLAWAAAFELQAKLWRQFVDGR